MRIGVDLGGTKIEALALSERGESAFVRRVPTPRGSYEETLAAVARLVLDLEREAGEVGTVGVGTPGAVSSASGLMKNANSVWLNGRDFPGDLSLALGRPVRVENDANCFALSEATDGAGRDAGVVFGVILGTGTGGGIVVNGRLLAGANAISGEWGHNPLPWPAGDELDAPECYCGRRGCIETFLSGPGLAEDHRRATGRSLGPERIAALADQGDPIARATLGRYVDRAARALATVVNLLDPDAIVLGGGMSNLSVLYDEIPRLWGAYIFSDRVVTPLLKAFHGDSSGVRGAARLWED